MSKVLDDAIANANSANALVAEIQAVEEEGTVTPVDKTVTSVTVNYSDGSSDTLSPSVPPTAPDTASDTASDSGSSDSSNTPADSDSGEPTPEPQPVAAGTIPDTGPR